MNPYHVLIRFSCARKATNAMQKAGAVSSETTRDRTGGSVTFHFASLADAHAFHDATVRFGQSLKSGKIRPLHMALWHWISQSGYEAP